MNWKSVIATAVITGLVTIGTGMILFWWQAKEAELTYYTIKSISFDDPSNSVFIQQVEIKNSGDDSAEDVTLRIDYPQDVIQRSNVFIDKAIKHTATSDAKGISLSIPILNPGENAGVSILVEAPGAASIEPEISLRAKGVSGKIAGDNGKQEKETLLIALVAVYAGMFAFLLSTKRGREALLLMIKSIARGKSIISGSQVYAISSSLCMYGFPEKAREYLNYGTSRMYWVEADLLAAEAIKSYEEEKRRMIKVLETIAEKDRIAEESKAIVYYNIARVMISSGVDSSEYLEKARRLDPNEIQSRLEKDPVFGEYQSNNSRQQDALMRASA